MLRGSQPESEAVRDRSIGYGPQGASAWTPHTVTLPYRGTSAGGGYSTVGDLMKFADALVAYKLLNAECTELVIKGKVDSGGGRIYAYGFEDGSFRRWEQRRRWGPWPTAAARRV